MLKIIFLFEMKLINRKYFSLATSSAVKLFCKHIIDDNSMKQEKFVYLITVELQTVILLSYS